MRLLIDAHCFDCGTSEGINTYIQGVYSELIKIGSSIEFWFIANNIENLKTIFGDSKNIHYIQLHSRNKIYRLLFEIPQIIRKQKIDCAHFQYISPLVKNCRTIVTLHDILFLDYPQYFTTGYRWSKKFLFLLSAKRADILLTVSEYSRKKISEHFNIDYQKIDVTPNAVSPDFFQMDLKMAADFMHAQGINKYLLYVSRFEPRKNQAALLKAYCELELWRDNIDLVFIGRETIPTKEFDSYLATLEVKIRDKIHIYHQVTFDELKFWYKNASLFVYTSLAEGFGIPPIEAGASGVPCICSNQTAMNDFDFFGKNLIDINDIETLKSRMKSELSTKNNDVVKIQSIIKEKYNWRISANIILNKIK